MNAEQVTSLVRQGMLVLAGMISGVTFISKFFTPDQVIAIFTSETVIGLIVSGVMGAIASAWALFTRSDRGLTAAVNALPQVQGVITSPTREGVELARSVPSATVVPAETREAAVVAGAQ
jgi:hypothetical protein